MDYRICPECGARLSEDAGRCDLCGAAVPGPGEPEESEDAGVSDTVQEDSVPSGIPEPSSEQASPEAGVFCNECGWKNPPNARYCSRCGAKLQALEKSGDRDNAPPASASGDRTGAPPPPPNAPAGGRAGGTREGEPAGPASSSFERKEARPAAAATPSSSGASNGSVTWHVAVLVGLAVLVVVALYMITVVSKQRVAPSADEAVAAPAEARAALAIESFEAIPISDEYRGQVDSLQQVIADAGGQEAVEARGALVDFLIGIGRIDRAAIEQQRLARLADDPAHWKTAGNLLFDWMERVQAERKTEVALLTIDAYKQVLKHDPSDLDARADLGWAYQHDPQNPMEAIRQTNLVLEEDPEHLEANYNKAVFLMRINRLDQAREQFRRVKDIAGSESPYFRQAEMWIETIDESLEQRDAG